MTRGLLRALEKQEYLDKKKKNREKGKRRQDYK